ncbi:MAG: glutathionylspermidine synthase family protein, partial [Polyangiaceae bacterium]
LYGFDDDTLRLASASHHAGDHASLMRVDLLLEAGGTWKACEINADCPGGHNETIALPRLARVAGFGRGRDPTRVMDRLAARLEELAGGGAIGLVYATGYAEDLQVCAFVKRALESRGLPVVLSPPTAPAWDGTDLCIRGQPVRVLYRYFPIEWMSGQRNIEGIARAVETGRVRTLTSFAHVFTQSKLALARCWESTVAGVEVRAFLPETHAILDVPRDAVARDRRSWVVKRAMGRVGEEVFVGALFDDEAEWDALVDEVRALAAGGEAWIAQRFVDQQRLATPFGSRYLTLGAYVLDGVFAGYFARVTPESHASHDALCVPVFVGGES